MAAAVVAQQQQEEEAQKRAQQQNQLQLDVVNTLQSMNNNSVIEENDDKGELTCYEDTSEMNQDENMMTQAETSGVSSNWIIHDLIPQPFLSTPKNSLRDPLTYLK